MRPQPRTKRPRCCSRLPVAHDKIQRMLPTGERHGRRDTCCYLLWPICRRQPLPKYSRFLLRRAALLALVVRLDHVRPTRPLVQGARLLGGVVRTLRGTEEEETTLPHPLHRLRRGAMLPP